MTNTHRIRLVIVVIALVLMLQIAPAGAAPGISPEDAKNIMPLSQVKRGMKGYGLTVFHGTKIEKFDVEILGVLKKVNTGKDLILVRIGGGPITSRETGIIAGMSGSPCYINGKIVGAVAYGNGYAKEPVGMLTPIEDMLEALDENLPTHASGYSSPQTLSEPVTVDGRSVTKIKIDAPGAPEGDASDGVLHMQPLMTPLMVSGLSPRGIERLAEMLAPFHIRPMAGIGGGPIDEVSPELQPGSAFGVSLASGDIDMTSIGTLTYRRGDKIVGFGHPMLGIGAIDAPLTTAFVDDLISSYRVSTKMASPIKTVGRIFQDRPWSVAGVVGKQPKTIPATIKVEDEMFGRNRTYKVGVINHPLLASRILTMVVGEAIYNTHPAPGDATAEVSYEVDADQVGKISRTNVFFDPVAIDNAALSDIGSLLGLLSSNRFHPLDIKSLNVTVRIADRRNTATIDRIFVKENEYEPGETVDVGVVLRPYKQDRITKTFSVKVPATAADGRITLLVRGGGAPAIVPLTASATSDGDGGGPTAGAASPIAILGSDLASADNVKQLISRYLERERNNEIVVQLMMRSTAISVAGEKLTGLPTAIADVMKSSRNSGLRLERDEVKQAFPQDMIVYGAATLSLNVKRKDFNETKSPAKPAVASIDGPDSSDGGASSLALGFGMDDYSTNGSSLLQMAEASVSVTETAPTDGGASVTPSQKAPGAGAPKASDTSTASGAKTETKTVVRQAKTWSQKAQADFAKGTFSGVSASSTNRLLLAPTLRSLVETTEQFVWCVTPANDGVYAGTGDSGRIYHISNSGKAEAFFETGELEVHALARDAAGNVYAATSPGGKVFRISPEGKGTVLLDADEKFVVALALDPEGNVYAGTGDSGKIYQITPNGTATTFATLTEQQVLSLAWDPKGSLLAGTGINGVLYRIDKQGNAAPLFDADEDSISAVVADAKGTIYAGTSPKGVIYKITPDGRAKPIFTKATRVLSMTTDSHGSIYAVSDGTVARIAPDESVVLLDPGQDKVQFLSVAFDGQADTLYAGTGNIGALYMSKCCEATGEYESPVHDTKMISKWGRIKWIANTPKGTSVEVQTRTGNVATPDSTWSAWSQPYTKASGEQIGGHAARYIQYRVTLKTSDVQKSPEVSAVTLSYLTPNQPPTVKMATPQGGEVWAGKKTLQWSGSDPDKDTLTYDVYYSADGGENWKSLVGGVSGTPAGPEKKVTESDVTTKVKTELEKSADVPKEMKDQVLKDQPNSLGDIVEKGEPAPASPAGESSSKTSHTWDTTKVADGTYVIKVVATDKTSNASDAQTEEVVSEPFVICNTAPKLTLYKSTVKVKAVGSATVAGTAASALAEITGVQFRIDGGAWTAASAKDGLYDSQYEAFALNTPDLAVGAHKVEVQAIDSAGNSATSTVEVTVS